MIHALVFAHPKPDSYTASIAHAYAAAARAVGHSVIVRDLYRMAFDPCLKASEIPTSEGFEPGPDVRVERRLLEPARVFAFVYPLWFNAPPAILKGYIDRVFGAGFGYELSPMGAVPLLEGRKLISFTSSGAPDAWVQETGAMEALKALFDTHLAASCGLTFVDHVHQGGIGEMLTDDWMQDILANVRRVVREHFAKPEVVEP